MSYSRLWFFQLIEIDCSRSSRPESLYTSKSGHSVSYTPSVRYECDLEGCYEKNGRKSTVSRKADLKRHKESVHSSPTIDCLWPRCSRRGSQGFCRKDHRDEHIRGYHGGELPDGTMQTTSSKRRAWWLLQRELELVWVVRMCACFVMYNMRLLYHDHMVFRGLVLSKSKDCSGIFSARALIFPVWTLTWAISFE